MSRVTRHWKDKPDKRNVAPDTWKPGMAAPLSAPSQAPWDRPAPVWQEPKSIRDLVVEFIAPLEIIDFLYLKDESYVWLEVYAPDGDGPAYVIVIDVGDWPDTDWRMIYHGVA